MNRCATVLAVAGIFSPQRLLLKLDNHAYSAKALHKIIETAGHVKSFELAAYLVKLNAEFAISGRHVNRLTQQIGAELEEQRDKRTEDYVHHRRQTPTVEAPAKVSVSVDGGRINTREPGHGLGVHEAGWREDKVGCLQVLEGPSFAEDPHPEPPKCFLDREHVKQLVKGFVQQKGIRSYDTPEGTNDLDLLKQAQAASSEPAAPTPGEAQEPATTQESVPEIHPAPAAKPDWPPERVERTCVASVANSQAFGKMLAAEAYARHFFAAGERSFLGDGLAYNWRIQEAWFADFTGILDFTHPLSYVYLTAKAVTDTVEQTWQRYAGWMTACWQGHVRTVVADMRQEQSKMIERLGEPVGKMSASDPREILRRTINYLENNAQRMAYPAYRTRGLPVTSAAVESLIKEFNYRVKGTEKFWNNPGGTEPILQVRAGVLSDDDRLATHILSRAGSAYRRRPMHTGQTAVAV